MSKHVVEKVFDSQHTAAVEDGFDSDSDSENVIIAIPMPSGDLDDEKILHEAGFIINENTQTTFSKQQDGNSQTAPIQQQQRGNKSSNVRYLIGILGIWAVVATVGVGFLLNEYFSTPDLQSTAEELKAQVNDLSTKVDQLNASNSALEAFNKQLETRNDALAANNKYLSRKHDLKADTNQDLTDEMAYLEIVKTNLTSNVENLSNINQDLEEQVESLNASNAEYKYLNKQLETSNAAYAANNTHLNEQNTQLEISNAAYAANNTVLSEINTKLEISNAAYQANNTLLNEQNDQLAATNQNLTSHVEYVTANNLELNTKNDNLEAVNQNLTDKVKTLEIANANLTSNVNDLSESVKNLTQTTENLSQKVSNLTNINADQAAQIITLQAENTALIETKDNLTFTVLQIKAENEDYREANKNLTSVVAFLDNTAPGEEPTFDEMIAGLSTQIGTSRVQLVRAIQLSYEELVDGYTCNLNVAFGSREFVANPRSNMTQGQVDAVIGYLDVTVLQRMCLGRDDFEQFLEQYRKDQSVTYGLLNEAMTRYYVIVADYYFPRSAVQKSKGVSEIEWANAEYECSNLPEDLKFRYN